MDQRLIDAARETKKRMLAEMTPEELRKWLPVEELLKGLSAEELARALPPETLMALAQMLRANGSPPKPQ